MTVKKIIGKVHLWVGLTSGVVVFIIAITGCIYAFEREISDLTQPFRFVEAQNRPVLPPSQLQPIALKAAPGKHLHGIQYGLPTDAARAIYYAEDHYYMAYINPYTGEVLKVKNMDRDFFRIVLNGHFYLWLPPTIGQPVVIVSTVVFVVMMITGIILWWPKNKAARKQRFKIKWNAAWRRKNYDLHNVFGFYMSWVAIFMAITGLVFGWKWFADNLYKAAGGKKSMAFEQPLSDSTKYSPTLAASNVDILYARMVKEHPEAETMEVHFPDGKGEAMEIAINPDSKTYWKTDYRYFDRYTMKELQVNHMYGRFSDLKAADKMMRMNYDIHIGAIAGFPGKLIAFFASLIAASLPVTGFMIWWGRKKKKTTTAKKKLVATPAVALSN